MAPQDLSRATFAEITEAFQDIGQYDELRAAFGVEEFEEILDIQNQQAPFAPLAGGKRMIVLPGIMGSVLTDTAGVRGDLWPSAGLIFGDAFDALELDAEGLKDRLLDVLVEARTLIPYSYYKLYCYFQKRGYIVTQCPFDWRRSIDSSAAKLKEHIAHFAGMENAGPDIILAAHSMGGLVARRYFDLFPDHALKHIEHLYMLGTPNHGSYSPPMAFSGRNAIVNAISWKSGIDIGRAIVASFPGLYEMFPHPAVFRQSELFRQEHFPESVSQLHLDAALHFQEMGKAVNGERMTVFATKSELTVVTAEIEKGTWRYCGAKAGDGTVPIQSAHLPGVRTYLAKSGHASLPRESEVLRAIDELTRFGTCDLDEYQPPFGAFDADEYELEEVSVDFSPFVL